MGLGKWLTLKAIAMTIKLKFRPSLADGGEGRLYFHIFYQRTSFRFATAYCIHPSEWDAHRSTVKMPNRSSARYTALVKLRKRVRWEQSALTRLANELIEEDDGVTASEIAVQWREELAQQPFFSFMQATIDRLHAIGRDGTERKYRSAMQSFERFMGTRDLMMWEIKDELIEDYQQWLANRGACLNTISFYMRILRAVYNRAVRNGIVDDSKPFAHVYTGIAATRKRAISLDGIQRIKDADVGSDKRLQLAKDLFLFSFYCRGMAFVDMAHLTRDCVHDGYLTYKRRKTKQTIIIRWEPQMQAIANRYKSSDRRLLPIIRDNGEPEYKQYLRMSKNASRWLKKVGRAAGIATTLTFYVARHSWSSIAKQRNHPIGVISSALGHTSERTTQIYLAALDNTAIDDANRDIIGSLK